ncbi:MAG: TolC family protein [Terriglobia bacterium]
MKGRMSLSPAILAALAASAWAQAPAPSSPATLSGTLSPAPPPITLQDAINRARRYGGQIQSANLAVLLAKEDSAQARALALPTVSAFNQFIYTEGNGTPSGVFVANDGVHIYNEQAVVHEELLAVFRHGEIRRAFALHAAAAAKVDVAARGLVATVIQDYYAIASAERKFVNAQKSRVEAHNFLDITQKQEKGGEAAHADVIKAQIQAQQRDRDLLDAQVAIEKAKIALGVLIFPAFSSSFSVVDDMSQAVLLPPVEEARAKATASSPDLRAARFTAESAGYDVGVARYGFLPSLALDFFYGINANEFGINGPATREPVGGALGNEALPGRHNLGYSAQVTLNIPVWNWGVTRSRVRQAEFKRDQAQLDVSVAERTLQSNLAIAYAEASAAQAQIESLRSSAELSAESLRLTILRYQAGEAAAFEVVDAQSTVTQARNAYDDGLARYRVALANIQTLTGTF